MSKDLFTTLYIPASAAEQVPLNDFIPDTEPQSTLPTIELIKSKALSQTKAIQSGQPRPLTQEESLAIDAVIQELQDRIVMIKNKILGLRTRVDSEAASTQGKELQFRVDIKGRPVLKRAIRKVFGTKTDTLTYSMYKEALELKRQIEQKEASDYLGSD